MKFKTRELFSLSFSIVIVLELEKEEKKTGINSFVCSLLRFEISIFPLLSKNIIANYFEEKKKFQKLGREQQQQKRITTLSFL